MRVDRAGSLGHSCFSLRTCVESLACRSGVIEYRYHRAILVSHRSLHLVGLNAGTKAAGVGSPGNGHVQCNDFELI